MKNYVYVFLSVFALLIIMPELIMAQPPGLPGAPDQAPLGGLALLAAAGGAYAVKKLREK